MDKFLASVIIFTCIFISSIAAAVSKGDIYYSIHNGSYRTEKSARRYCEEVKKSGVPSFIDKCEIKGKGTWYRVYIGKYADINAAKVAFAALKKKKIDNLGSIKKFQSPGPRAKTAISVSTSVKNIPSETKLAADETRAIKRVKNSVFAKGVPSVKDLPNPVIEKAEIAFQKGLFSEAVTILDNFVANGNKDNRLIVEAQRLRAECLYRIGINGDSRDLLKAVENYKVFLKNYQDPAAGNDMVYCNLAKSYEKLNFFYEAAAAWEGIVLSYPDSPCFEEALFRCGYVLVPTGKKEKTYERLFRYVKSYPNGSFAGLAYYAIGHSLYRMGGLDQAVKWFDSARKRRPDISDLGKDIIERMGLCYFERGRYKDALSVFSFMTSVYPDADASGDFFFLTARSADIAGYPYLALKLYGLYIMKYPQGTKVDECEFFLANLGLEKPELDSTAAIWHLESYLKPLQTYDRLLSKRSSVDPERVMLWRGKALEKNGNFRNAIDNYIEMQKKYPHGKLKEIASIDIRDLIERFLDRYYTKKDYTTVAELYFKLKGKIPLCDNVATCIKFGKSLQRTGFYTEARDLYAGMKNIGNYDDREVIFALIELDIDMNDAVAAEYKLGHLPGKKGRGFDGRIYELMRKLADLYMSSGNFGKAAALYGKVISAGGQNDPVVHFNYGRCLEALKNPHQARKNFETALKYCENNRKICQDDLLLNIYIGIGDTWSVQGEFDKGIGMYRNALEHVSDNESKRWLMLKIGKAYNNIGNTGEAEKSFSRIKEIPDGNFWPVVADFYITQVSQARESKGRQ